jgi:pimeloyl-ACP methyl ester carboxylesterase
VVLEAPATAMSSSWAWVQADVARVTRVCSYDRAGLGWSEAGDAPFDPRAVPTELHTLLGVAREDGSSQVIVGEELGAAYASMYAAAYPDDVAALVLVNPPRSLGSDRRSATTERLLTISPWLARTGVLRAMRTLSKSAAALPQPAAGTLASFLNRPDHLTRAASELSHWNETVGMADAATRRRALPVTQVELEGRDPVAALADRRNAQDVAAAILRDVAAWRARQAR